MLQNKTLITIHKLARLKHIIQYADVRINRIASTKQKAVKEYEKLAKTLTSGDKLLYRDKIRKKKLVL
jgi:hypothetical protein